MATPKKSEESKAAVETKAPETDNLENDVPDNHGKTFKVKRHLQHNGTLHKAGAEVREALFTPEQIEVLSKIGTIEEVKEQSDAEK